MREQVLDRLLMEDNDFPLFLYVTFVDEAPLLYLDGFERRIIGKYTVQLDAEGLLAVGQGDITLADGGACL